MGTTKRTTARTRCLGEPGFEEEIIIGPFPCGTPACEDQLAIFEEAGRVRKQCRPGVQEDTTCTFTSSSFCAEDLEGADRRKYRDACSGNIGGQTTIQWPSNGSISEVTCRDIPRNPGPLGGVRKPRQLAYTSP